MIVKLHISGQPGKQARYIGVFLQVDVFILEATPEPLNEDVVHSAAAVFNNSALSKRFINTSIKAARMAQDEPSPPTVQLCHNHRRRIKIMATTTHTNNEMAIIKEKAKGESSNGKATFIP